MKKILPYLILILISGQVLAQQVITGRVNAAGEVLGLQGVKVQAQNQAASTITDYEGNYSLTVPGGTTTLVFSIDGYQTQTVEIGNRGVVDVEMSETDNASDNQVSVGFGTQSKKEITGSVGQIDAEDIGSVPVIDLEQASQGRASGVFIQNNSGKLGEGTSVRIRGGSSLSASNQPLYVVDGIPLTSGTQSDIDPTNIASMEILKDASAAAIYGSRAANGVIIITTKTGTPGKLKIDAEYQFGISETPRTYDLYSADEYNLQLIEFTLRSISLDSEISREALEGWLETLNSGSRTLTLTGNNSANITSTTLPPFFDSLTNNTDWQDEVFRTATSHQANVNLSGGSKNHRFFTGVAYKNQEGILIGNDYERINARFNLNSNLSSALSTSLSVNYTHTLDNRLNEDQDLGSPLQAIVLPPSDRYDPNDNFNLVVRSNDYNPLTEINFSDNIARGNSVIGNLGINYQISDALSFDLQGGLDFFNQRLERRQGPETRDGSGTGLSRLTETDVLNYIGTGYFTYKNDLPGNQKFSAILGASYQLSNVETSFRRARINSISRLENLTESDTSLQAIPIPDSKSSFVSSFLRLNYSIDDKYIFQASARIDGSSKFSEDNRFGFFPAISAGWNISEEDFFDVGGSISFVKLKASYGLVGNTPEDDFLYRSNYFLINYGRETGVRLSNLSNSSLKWENTAQLDVGLELGLFNDRVTASLEYYQKNTTDLLFPVPVSLTSGFSNVLRNIGELQNTGFEFNLGSTVIQNSYFSWSTDFNISFNENKVTDIGGRQLIVGVNAFLEDQSTGVFYMRKYVGVDPFTGSALYDDGQGGTTTDWENAPRMVVGDPNPDFFGGLTNNVAYKNFKLSFLFQFVSGVDVYNATGEFLSNSGIQGLSQSADQANRWYTQGDDAPFPAHDPFQENTFPSTRWLEDGSYIRLKTATLTYDVPQSTIQNLGIRNLSFYIGGQNLFTLTDYSGYDPDVNYVDPTFGTIENNISRGIDNFTAPQARTFITGIKIGL
ncbi:MAG: SusC/RagA family TonB-linked outer membrane protein [Cyclobacteriaceae bacterium]|nr:SusC/RagA family TonB-linked outer membrane protein [Cyclobacteriaceae bacterium HetDA_MAG_MS6]